MKKQKIAITMLIALIFGVVLSEIILRTFGFGSSLLYDSNHIYSFRPLPNQDIKRSFGARVRINSLGLRSDDDD